MALRFSVLCFLFLFQGRSPAQHQPAGTRSEGPVFEVSPAGGLIGQPRSGRLFVVVSRTESPEPRLTIGTTEMNAPVVIARDVAGFTTGAKAMLDGKSIAFPLERLSDLPAGEYFVQALFDDNDDLKSVNAPGNFYSTVTRARLDPLNSTPVSITLTGQVPRDRLPPETEYVKYLKIESKLLTRFHGRPIYLRCGIVLPRGFNEDTTRRYPVEVNIGGYGESYTDAGLYMDSQSGFRKMWLSDSTPRMILLQLDGDGPFGDCYQVNSANNGPYGDAVTSELIPTVEKKFRGIGKPSARFLTGGSTGGWASLALQIFYPDSFNGTWSGFPDPVDFRAYQLINIYEDTNAFINKYGFERPAARSQNGDVLWTMRHEIRMENVMGTGSSYTRSGGQWGAWNAVYSPRSPEGEPVPIWDPKTGRINPEVATQWKKYDLRLILQDQWQTLGPKLKGKLHVWVGEADDYFLNNAVHFLDDFLSKADPPYGGWTRYGARGGHGWSPLSHHEIMGEMMERMGRGNH